MRTVMRRRLGPLGALLLALIGPTTAAGTGRTYEVVQCDPLNRGVSGVALEDAPSYAVKQGCGDPKEDHAIKVTNTRFAQHGRSGRVHWSMPSPSLRIMGAQVQANLRRDHGHVARLWLADGAGHEIARVASGGKHATGFRKYSWHSTGPRAQQFVAHLRCELRRGCKHSDVAKTWLRDVHLEVADYADPRLNAVRGSLLDSGWLRGERTLDAHASDLGSGVSQLSVSVNGVRSSLQNGSCNEILGTRTATQFSSCESEALMQTRSLTTEPPFHDGRNAVAVCALDFATNGSCRERRILVDNKRPSVVFTNFQNPNDPELIRASVSGATSGVASGQLYYRAIGSTIWRPLTTQHRFGQLRARIDSTIDPPGQYEFMATAIDAAGNKTFTTKRANGQPMVLMFPLKSGVRLKAHLAGGSRKVTLSYGRPSKVWGVLQDASGQPLSKQEVTVTEYFGEGALIDRRVRTVHTDSRGRWKERLPGGPSRKVTASYAGTRRYLPEATQAGNLRVKTKASFHLSRHRVREGHKVAFKGRIGHFAARIPSAGKLVELDVKDGKNWQTVRHPFYTRPNGKYRLHYRFGRFYVSNVRYRFRVRVIRERNWPYKAPVSSRVRKLIVKAR